MYFWKQETLHVNLFRLLTDFEPPPLPMQFILRPHICHEITWSVICLSLPLPHTPPSSSQFPVLSSQSPVPSSQFPVLISHFRVPSSQLSVPISQFTVHSFLIPDPCTLIPVPWSLYPVPWSLFPAPCSLFPDHWSLIPDPWSQILNQSRIMYTHPLPVKFPFSGFPEENVTLPHDKIFAFSHNNNISSSHDDHVSSSHDNNLPCSLVPLCAALCYAVNCWSPQLLRGPEKALGGCVTSCLFICQGSWGLVLAGRLQGWSERSVVLYIYPLYILLYLLAPP